MRAEPRGAALLMVVFILGAMAMLATPFLIAMVLQEKGSRGYLAASQARAGAVGARNYAVTELLKGHEYREARGGEEPFNTPEYDLYDEVVVPIDGRRAGTRRGGSRPVPLAAVFGEGVVNPRGMIWGLETQDEQGKLDWRSVPDYCAARLAEAVRETGSDPLNVFTRYAVRPARWIAPQTIRHAEGNRICLDERTYFLEGSNVRISDGARSFVARVTLNRDNAGACATCGRVPIGVSGDGSIPAYGWVEVEQRHPLNLNSARRETIAAAFEGLRIRRGSQEISREEAYQIAQMLLDRPILGEADFVRFLLDLRGILTDEEVSAVALNSRAPTHLSLHHTEMVQVPNPNNPNQPNWNEEWHDPHGTVPFTWRTENVYTIEAAGTRNTLVGTELATARFREVVSVAPPERLRWVIDDQRDFEAYLQSDGFSLRNHADFTRGYPFGNKVVSYPARYWLKTTDLPFGEFPGTGGVTSGAPGNPARGVRPIPAKDRRRVLEGHTGWVNHFMDMECGAEGRLLGGPLDQPVSGTRLLETNSNRTSEVRTFWTEEMHRPGQAPPRFDVRAGGIEFWFKTTGGDPVLFDIADRDWEDRLVCFVRGGEILLRACDGTIDRRAAEVRGRVSLQADTWYHLGAYWDSTKLGGLALFLDGRPVAPARNTGACAHVDDQDRPIIAELASNLAPTDTTLSISNAGQFPSEGVIQIGAEAIEYSGFSSSGFTNCIRGARRTGSDPDGKPLEGLDHPAGAKITLYGYVNPVERRTINFQWGGGSNPQSVDVVLDRIPAARGTLADGFGVNTAATYISKKEPDPAAVPPEPGGINETDTTIEVFPTGPITPAPPIPAPVPAINAYDTADFPSRGYLKIGSEVIYYTGKTATAFTGCQRGQLGTTAARHNYMARIELFGFPVGGATGFASPALVQVDDEWFGPCMLNNSCFTGLILGGVADRLRRGWRQTVRQAHTTGTLVLPVFALEYPYGGSEDFTLACPTNRDTVTIVDRTGNKEPRRFRVVRNKRRNPADLTQWMWEENLAGFDEAVNQDYPADKPYVRLLKFPSGELMTRVPSAVTIGGSQAALGGSGGGRAGGGLMIDELRYVVANRGRSTRNTTDNNRRMDQAELAQAVSGSDDTIRLLNSANLPRDGGLVVLGDEIIAYREFVNGNPDELRRCERGYFGTTAAAHDRGDPLFLIGSIPVGFLGANLSGSAPILTLVGQPRGFPSEGYVLVENEVIGYTRARTNPMGMYELEMPVNRRGEGILHGRFGTSPAAHANEAVVVGIPFRYWDRYAPGVDDSQMVYYGASKSVLNATWKSLTCTIDDADKGHEVLVQARFDSRPAWDGSVARDGRLFQIAGGGSSSLEVTADLIEIRVLFGYKSGAYLPNHTWKRAPTLSRIVVDYEQPTKTLYHEER